MQNKVVGSRPRPLSPSLEASSSNFAPLHALVIVALKILLFSTEHTSTLRFQLQIALESRDNILQKGIFHEERPCVVSFVFKNCVV